MITFSTLHVFLILLQASRNLFIKFMRRTPYVWTYKISSFRFVKSQSIAVLPYKPIVIVWQTNVPFIIYWVKYDNYQLFCFLVYTCMIRSFSYSCNITAAWAGTTLHIKSTVLAVKVKRLIEKLNTFYKNTSSWYFSNFVLHTEVEKNPQIETTVELQLYNRAKIDWVW